MSPLSPQVPAVTIVTPIESLTCFFSVDIGRSVTPYSVSFVLNFCVSRTPSPASGCYPVVPGVHSQVFILPACEAIMLRCIFVSVLLLAMTFMGVAQDRSYGRSMVITDRGIVATSQYLASQAGARMLARGGSAMDAAIAANAVLGVTEPMMNGMGGDLFLLYWDAKTGKLAGLNASGWAPKGLSIAYLKARDVTVMPEHGIDSVTVPGAVEGWSEAHQRFGKLPWKELFGPAIYYAEHGYPVAELVYGYWQRGAPVFQ